MHEPLKPVIKNTLPPLKAREVDFKKVYALLYRAYLRSQSPKNVELSHKEENTHE